VVALAKRPHACAVVEQVAKIIKEWLL